MTGGLMSHVTTFSLSTIGSIWLKQTWKCAKCVGKVKDWNQFIISWILGSGIMCPPFLCLCNFTWCHLMWMIYLDICHARNAKCNDSWTNASIWLQSRLTMASAWNQYGSNPVVLSGSSQICHWTEDVAEKNWPSDPDLNVELFDVASPWCLDT